MPWLILAIESVGLLLFFYLKFLVDEQKLILFGNYHNDPQDWGTGLANVGVYLYNLVFIIALFLATQIFFWAFFIRKFRLINKSISEKEIKPDDFLASDRNK